MCGRVRMNLERGSDEVLVECLTLDRKIYGAYGQAKPYDI